MVPASLKRYALLSIAAALATILLKGLAWWLTGSVGLLSDALESFVNLAGALMALAMLTLAALPADENHAYGHGKAEYFSSAFEGLLILIAALAIGYAAIERLVNPRPLESLGVGLAVSVVASIINYATARILLDVGRKHQSITLEADAHHLMTDVWTSAGVIVGVSAVWLTGWQWLDPVLALLVAANIVWTGWQLLRRSADGLMDVSMPRDQRQVIVDLLDGYRQHGLDYHALRTRQAGARGFVTLHVLVPGAWTVQIGHDWLERIEADIRAAVPNVHVTTHLEPLEDPLSHADQHLDR
ncbi:MAG: cation diffusion facilitator family transporter [Thiobacillaceae bacterium]|jgi:cation diffusion facilitator family transporter|nr:cation diffusion facilitator family transporter [Thiobacillaceae bacterium]